MDIAVIIPAFNAADTIKRCIESALRQIYSLLRNLFHKYVHDPAPKLPEMRLKKCTLPLL